MADKQLNFNLTAKDQSVSSTFSSAADAGSKFSEKIGSAISTVGDKIGGEVGEIVSQFGEGFEKITASGTSSFQKIGIASGVVTGIGVALQSFASKGQAAENQLKAAVDASGDSWDDYEGKVNKAVSSEAKYAHDTADTETALRTLDTATGSMDTSLADLNVTTNLAAAKHESLADAASQVAKIYSGNTKLLKQYGIDMTVTAGNTDQAGMAITALGQKLGGQAAAQADTFSGKVAAVKTQVEDWGEKVAGFIGGPLTLLGTVTGAVTGVMEISASAIALVKGRHAENAVATLADSSAQDRLAATTALVTDAETEGAVAANAESAAYDRVAASAAAAAGAQEGQAAAAGGAGAATAASGLSAVPVIGTFIALGVASHILGQKLDESNWAKWQGLIADAKSAASAQAAQTAIDAVSSSLGTQADGLAYAADQAKAYQDSLNDAAAKVTTEQDLLSQSTDAVSAAFQGELDSVDNLLNPLLSAQDASLHFQDALQTLTDQVTSNAKANDAGSRSLDTNTSAGRQNAESIDGLVDSARQQADTALKQGASTDVVTKAYAANVAQIVATATHAGISKTAVEAYLKKLGATPAQISTAITVSDAAALSTLQELNALAVSLDETLGSSAAAVRANQIAPAPKAKAPAKAPAGRSNKNVPHASGGEVGGSTFDEVGLEAMNLPDGTIAIPHGQTQQLMRGMGGGDTYTINLYALNATHETGQMIAQALNQFRLTPGATNGNYQWLAA